MSFPAFEQFDIAVAEFLAERGACQSPYKVQKRSDVPAVFVNFMPDTPDKAIMLRVSNDDRDSDDCNPLLTLTVAFRGDVDDLLSVRAIGEQLFHLLHEPGQIQLTALQQALFSRRISKGIEVQDKNRRFVRVDAFQIRPLIPLAKGQ